MDKDHLAMYPYCGLGSDPSKNFKAKVRTKQDDLKATGIFDLIYEAIPISLPTNAKERSPIFRILRASGYSTNFFFSAKPPPPIEWSIGHYNLQTGQIYITGDKVSVHTR